jgi:hypothetical protein
MDWKLVLAMATFYFVGLFVVNKLQRNNTGRQEAVPRELAA